MIRHPAPITQRHYVLYHEPVDKWSNLTFHPVGTRRTRRTLLSKKDLQLSDLSLDGSVQSIGTSITSLNYCPPQFHQ